MLAIVSNGAGTFAVDRAVRKNDPLPVALPPPVLHPPEERAIRPQLNRSDQPLLHVPARPFQGNCIKRSTEPVIHEYPREVFSLLCSPGASRCHVPGLTFADSGKAGQGFHSVPDSRRSTASSRVVKAASSVAPRHHLRVHH